MTTCAVLEELNLGRCPLAATVRVHDFEDTGTAEVLSCDLHVGLARQWVRDETRGGLPGESRFVPRSALVSTAPTLWGVADA